MSITSKNLHYAYYHDYYDGTVVKIADGQRCPVDVEAAERIIRGNNEALLGITPVAPVFPKGVCNKSFLLKTDYPGMVTGVGISHGQKIKDEFSMGFLFDYVTGCPYISGASIKGVLRQAFQYDELIQNWQKISASDVELLEKNIFDGVNLADKAEIPVARQDIFFDAYPCTNGGSRKILDADYITPHVDIITEPTPIRFLKVKPNVTFCFRFRLYDSELSSGICVTAEQKKDLFAKIIMYFGVGAKTNVGYGAFVDINTAVEVAIGAETSGNHH